MKIAVLWTGITGYLNACLQALSEIPGTSLFVSYELPNADAPFETAQFDWISNAQTWTGSPDKDLLLRKLEAFEPDLIIGAAYHVPAYRAVCRRFAKRALRVYCTDNQWRGTPKQWLGVVTAPWYVRALYDAIFIPGERQRLWARQMGFRDDQIWHGCFTCDTSKFAPVYSKRSLLKEAPPSFLNVGRLSAEKGIDVLMHAYSAYRESSSNPWPLVIAGTGPLIAQAEGQEGIIVKGFVQPDDLPALFESAGALLVPSTYEPWSLVIHEAATTGVPVICTAECGASVRLVQDGYSGYIVETGNSSSLSRALSRFACLPTDRRVTMGEASHSLSLQFTPQRWAQYVYEKGTELVSRKLPRRAEMKSVPVQRELSRTQALANSSDMPDAPPRVVLLTNGFTPNRIPLWNAVNRQCDLTLVLLSSTEKRRQWDLALEQVEARVRIAGAKQFFFTTFDWSLNLAFRSISKILDEVKPHAVIIGGYDSPAYWAANTWARKRQVPVVMWMGSTLLSSRMMGNPVLDFIKRYFFTRCDAYYAYGHFAGEYLQHYGARASRIVEGVNQTNVEHFVSCERTSEYETCALLYVGQLIPRKGIVELFDALVRVTDLRWTLTVAGDGDLRSDLMAKAKRYGFADRILWKGYVQQKDLSPVYRSADLLFMPSLNEVWGLVINEALMSGVYVIGSNRAAASLELIQPGVNGEIVEPKAIAIERAMRAAIARAPFDRCRIRETISSVTPQSEAAKIMHAIQLASS